jgi:hypothetical protein
LNWAGTSPARTASKETLVVELVERRWQDIPEGKNPEVSDSPGLPPVSQMTSGIWARLAASAR